MKHRRPVQAVPVLVFTPLPLRQRARRILLTAAATAFLLAMWCAGLLFMAAGDAVASALATARL